MPTLPTEGSYSRIHRRYQGKTSCGVRLSKYFKFVSDWENVTCIDCLSIRKQERSVNIFLTGNIPDTEIIKTDWTKIRKYCEKYAERKGQKGIAEDFSQYACLILYRGRRASISKIFIDFIRDQYGRTNKGGVVVKPTKIGPKNSYSYDTSDEFGHQRPLISNERSPEEFRTVEDLFKDLNRIERCIAKLKGQFGLTNREIADTLELHEGTICNILSKVKVKLKDKLSEDANTK